MRETVRERDHLLSLYNFNNMRNILHGRIEFQQDDNLWVVPETDYATGRHGALEKQAWRNWLNERHGALEKTSVEKLVE